MKTKWLFAFLLLFSLTSIVACKKNDQDVIKYDSSKSYDLINIKYGNENRQVMDVYLPANRTKSSTKVFILVHGGGWTSGDKSHFDYMYNTLKQYYPQHAIAKINYRYGTTSSPAYPKQIEDIRMAIAELQKEPYQLKPDYFFMGSSAGAHLSLLYAFSEPCNGQIKGIANTVGPVDFTDPAYTQNSTLQYALYALIGPYTYQQKPALYAEVSPVNHVKACSPPVISFYGDSDELIPNSQMNLLHNKLDQFGVYNEKTMYTGEGHGNWSNATSTDAILKLANFINTHFSY